RLCVNARVPRAGAQGIRERTMRLLEGNRSASGLEDLLGLLCSFLVRALENSLGSAVDDSLGLAEAERGELADSLDDLDLLVASSLEDDVEGVLLFLSLSGARTGCTSSGDGGSSGDLELLLECLDEVVELDEGQVSELLEQLLSGELSHDVSPIRWGLWEENAGRLRALCGLQLCAKSVDGCGSLGHRRLHHARCLRKQNLTALERGVLVDLVGVEDIALVHAALDHEKRVGLGEVTKSLRSGDEVTVHESDSRRALEV